MGRLIVSKVSIHYQFAVRAQEAARKHHAQEEDHSTIRRFRSNKRTKEIVLLLKLFHRRVQEVAVLQLLQSGCT